MLYVRKLFVNKYDPVVICTSILLPLGNGIEFSPYLYILKSSDSKKSFLFFFQLVAYAYLLCDYVKNIQSFKSPKILNIKFYI